MASKGTCRCEPGRAGAARRAGRWRSASHWTAHFASLLAIATSCVVSDPPEYSNPAATPPLLVLLEAFPSVGKVQIVNTGDLMLMAVPVRAEDQPGDELIARLYLDFRLDTEAVQAPLAILPVGSYDDERSIDMSWVVPQLDPGCRQLMLVVTHRSNLDSAGRPLQNRDTAVAVWWLNVNDASSDNPMSACPKETIAP